MKIFFKKNEVITFKLFHTHLIKSIYISNTIIIYHLTIKLVVHF